MADTPQYYSFKGSPDVFDSAGAYVSGDQAKTLGLTNSAGQVDTGKITPLDYVRPDVKTSTDFAAYAGKSVDVSAFTKPAPNPAVPPPDVPTDYKSVLAGAMASIPNTTSEQAAYDSTYKNIISKVQSLEGQPADQTAAEDAAGVSGFKKTLSDLTASLSATNAEATAANERSNNRQTVYSQVVGEQGQIERLRAIKALSISAQIQAAQGNLTLAQDHANRAVDLKYNTIKNQLTTLNTTLDYNYKNLSTAEQKKADALKQVNDLKLKMLDTQVANEKEFESAVNVALSRSASLSVINQARALYAAGNSDGARSLLAPYTGPISQDNGGNTKVFTQNQINNGAAAGGLKIADFQKLDPDTQNLFINGTVKDQLDAIDGVKTDNTWTNNAGQEFSGPAIGPAMEAQIHNGNAPDAVKDVLVRKVQALFPPAGKSWWQKFLDGGKPTTP